MLAGTCRLCWAGPTDEVLLVQHCRSLANEVCTVDEAKAVYPFMGEHELAMMHSNLLAGFQAIHLSMVCLTQGRAGMVFVC